MSYLPTKPEDDLEEDGCPDSAVRLIPEAPDSSVRPITSSAGAREVPIPEDTRILHLSIRVSEALLGPARAAYLTISGADEGVLFEGDVGEDGAIDLCLPVPADTCRVHALLEAGTKYRNALISLRDDGVTDYAFA